MFFVGNIDEVRIFGEYIPMATLAVVSVISNQNRASNDRQ